MPLTATAAESLVLALEGQLKELPSPVLDVSLPSGELASEPRLVVVGDTHGQLQDVLHIFEERGPPSPSNAYLFNGDIVDRGRYAVEIWLLLIAFKLRYPGSVHVLRGNHENSQMMTRPLKMGGGFAEECLTKYSRPLFAGFQRVFKLLPLFAVIEEEVFVVHGGLFRNPEVNLARLRSLPEAAWRRNYPNPLTKEQLARGVRWSEEEEIIFDAQWADPHHGPGSRPSTRGRVAMTFGEDVTQRFLEEAGLSLCIRSHRVPQSGRGYEFEHGGRLLTLFSASRYGGVLHNRGAVVVLERAQAGDGGGGSSSSSCPTPTPPLRRLRLSVFEHDVAAPPPRAASQSGGGRANVADTLQLSASTASQVRRIVEQHAREHEVDMEQHALGLICSAKEELWRRCRQHDASGSGLVPRRVLCDLLEEVCGELGWEELLRRAAPGLGERVAYGEFLATPRVRWFHLGAAQVVTVARATAQAELQLSGLAALFDSLQDGVVTPQLARKALRQLLPSLREHQRQQLAASLFGSEPAKLSAVLHRLALFADPPRLEEPWMQPALRRLAALIEKHHGPPPPHCALIRFFRSVDCENTGLVRADEFVKGLQDLGAYRASGDAQVPLLHSGRLYKLFEVIDGNRTGTISFLELLLAMDERSDRPELPEFGALEGAVPALLLVHKVAVLRICTAMDVLGQGRISGENFSEVVAALLEVVGRPLAGAGRRGLEEELQGEDLPYAEVLASFEVSAEGGPWRWGGQP